MTTDLTEIDPKVMMGKLVIRGTRIKVELVLRKLAEGATEDDLLDAYPRLTREDIRGRERNSTPYWLSAPLFLAKPIIEQRLYRL